jgi:hypothetical protein
MVSQKILFILCLQENFFNLLFSGQSLPLNAGQFIKAFNELNLKLFAGIRGMLEKGKLR